MSTIAHFTPKRDLDALQNVKDYVEFQRQHCPFTEVNWVDQCWDVSAQIEQRGRGVATRLYWSAWRDRTKKKGFAPLGNGLIDFAKAYVSEEFRTRKLRELGRHISALRAIDDALHKRGKTRLVEVDHATLTMASTLLMALGKNARWGVGRHIEKIAEALANLGVDACRGWKNPHPWPGANRSNAVPTGSDNAPQSKLPDVGAIVALGQIFARSENPSDVITTSFAALAMTAPSRGSEVLTLPANCLTTASHDEGEITGLKWRPAKGGAPKTNFCVGDDAADVAKEAVTRLLELGASARKAAAWYEENPNSLYLPPGYEHLRGESLTLQEMSAIMGKPYDCDPRNFGTITPVTRRLVSSDPDRFIRPGVIHATGQLGLYSFSEFESHVLSQLPLGFPHADRESGLKVSEALFCLPRHILRPRAVPLAYIPQLVTLSMISHQLGTNPQGITVFSRNDAKDSSGKRHHKITSHQFRHLLNTLAQTKHLSQALIAFWSGRRDVNQNEWYNHIPQEAFIEAYLKLLEGMPEPEIDGPLASKAKDAATRNVIDLKTALSTELGSTHITRFGLCRHDYALTPCPKDKACVDCGEHVFTKGSEWQLTEAQTQLAAHEKAVAEAEKALANEMPGAQRWLDLNKPKRDRWRKAVEKLTDPSIPDGTIISLDAPEHQQSKSALAVDALESQREADADAADIAVALGMV